MGRIIILIGKRFGRLTVIEKHSYDSHGHVFWLCKCDCGNIKSIASSSLLRAMTTSCGCFRKECLENRPSIHRGTKTPEYKSWLSMKRRCYCKTDKQYSRWGGRGITVCDKWKESFPNFLSDMGEKPSPYHTIDRIDNNGNYTPENCKWSNPKEQSRNRRSNKWYEYNGLKMIITDWGNYFGISSHAIQQKIRRGSTFDEVFEYYTEKGRY